MSDENGVAEGAPAYGWRAVDKEKHEAQLAALRSREVTGDWRRANLEMKAQAKANEGWESDPKFDHGTGRPTVRSTNQSRANRYVTAADLEADPYAAMDRAATLVGNNPLDRIPQRDEYGFAVKRNEAPRVPMPEAPVLMELDDNPETALQQLGGMFRNALGALDRWRTRRAERKGSSTPAIGTPSPATGHVEPVRSFLSDVAGRDEQPTSIPDAVASIDANKGTGNVPDVITGADPELAGVLLIFVSMQEDGTILRERVWEICLISLLQMLRLLLHQLLLMHQRLT